MAATIPRASATSPSSCVVGPETSIRGNLSGQEDLVVQGRLEGTVSLSGHLIVAESGNVEADVDVESIEVHGTVQGDISASRSITIEKGAHVTGNVKAPRVIINDGARFDGAVEMDVDLPDGLRKAVR